MMSAAFYVYCEPSCVRAIKVLLVSTLISTLKGRQTQNGFRVVTRPSHVRIEYTKIYIYYHSNALLCESVQLPLEIIFDGFITP